MTKGILKTFIRTFTKKVKLTDQHLRNIEDKLMFGGLLETKKEKKKRKRREQKLGVDVKSADSVSINSEQYWLAHIAAKDIKLYRKTSTGRYKEVDKNKVLNALCDHKVGNTIGKRLSIPQIILENVVTTPLFNNTHKIESLDVKTSELPSVTKILSATLSEKSKKALERWKQQMILELGDEGFLIHNKEQLATGAKFHETIKNYLEGIPEELEPSMEKTWSSVEYILKKITNVQLLEAPVEHPTLLYKGIVDCVASYMDVPTVIEWKLSGKGKASLSATYDAPLQLSAYLGALSNNQQCPATIRNGIIVVAYKDGTPADVFPMNEQLCLQHWSLWLRRLQQYWQSHTN